MEVGLPWNPKRVSRTRKVQPYLSDWNQDVTTIAPVTQNNLWDNTQYQADDEFNQQCFCPLSDKVVIERAKMDAEEQQTKICGLTFPPRPYRICLALRSNDEYNHMDMTTTCRSCKTVRIAERSHIDSEFQPKSSETAVGWTPRQNVRLLMNKNSIRHQKSLKRKMDQCIQQFVTKKDVVVTLDQGMDMEKLSNKRKVTTQNDQSREIKKTKKSATTKKKATQTKKKKTTTTTTTTTQEKKKGREKKKAPNFIKTAGIADERRTTSKRFLVQSQQQQKTIDTSKYGFVHVPESAFNKARRILTSEMCQEKITIPSGTRPEFWNAVMQYALYVSCIASGVPLEEHQYLKQFNFEPIVTNNKLCKWNVIIRMFKERGEYPKPVISTLMVNYTKLLCSMPGITKTEQERETLTKWMNIYVDNLMKHTTYLKLGPKSEQKMTGERKNTSKSSLMNRNWALPVLVCFLQIYEVEQKTVEFDLEKVLKGQSIFCKHHIILTEKRFIESKNTHFKYMEDRRDEEEKEEGENGKQKVDLNYSWFLLERRKKNGLRTKAKKMIPEGRWKVALKTLLA